MMTNIQREIFGSEYELPDILTTDWYLTGTRVWAPEYPKYTKVSTCTWSEVVSVHS